MGTMNKILFLVFALLSANPSAKAQSKASDDAFARGVELYGIRKYAEAIPFFQKADSIESLEQEEGTFAMTYSSLWIANCYYKLGDIDKAKEISPYFYMLPPVDKRLTVRIDSLADIGNRLMNDGDFEGALHNFELCAEIEKSTLGANSWFYANSLIEISTCFLYLEDYDSAFSKANEALKISRLSGYDYGIANCYELLGEISSNMEDKEPTESYGYYRSSYEKFLSSGYDLESISPLLGMAVAKINMEEYDDAYDYCKEAKERVDNGNLLEGEPGNYAYLLSIMAQIECKLMMFEETFQHSNEAKKFFEEDGYEIQYEQYMLNEFCRAYSSLFVPNFDNRDVIKEVHKRFAESEYRNTIESKIIERFYYCCNPDNIPFTELVAAQRRLLADMEDIEGCKSASYLEVLCDILNEYEEDENNTSASVMALYEEILALEDKVEELNVFDLTTLLKNMSIIESGMMGDSRQAIATLEKGINILKQENWQLSLPYCQLLNLAAQTYMYINEYYKAYEFIEEALDVYSRMKKENETFDIYGTNVYYNTMLQMTAYHCNLGNVKQMDECLEMLRELNPTDFETNSVILFYRLSSIIKSSSETEEEKIEEVDRLFKSLLNLTEESEGKNNVNYSMLAMVYSYILIGYGKTEEADHLIGEARKYINSKLGGSMLAILSELLYAQLLTFKGDLSEAKSVLSYILPKAAEKSDAISPEFLASAYQNMISIYESEGKYDETLPYINKVFQTYKNILNTNFRSMSYKERCGLWDKFSQWFTVTMPCLAYHGRNEDLDAYLYNSVLMSKGFLLNSEIELRKLVAESGDEYSLALYDDLQKLYKRRKNAAGNADEQANLAKDIDAKEKELVNSVKAFDDYTKNLSFTWEDVRESLSPDEAAIEFIVSPISKDSIMYSALILRSNAKPKRIDLFNEWQITSIPNDSLYVSTSLADLVWEPLAKELEGVKNVYFAPQRLLYSTAIEYAPTHDGNNISDRYNLWRLSSTREKVLSHYSKEHKSAVLYGGLDYNADTTSVMKANVDQSDLDVFKPRAAVEDLRNINQGVSNLRYTLDEIENIGKMYVAVNQECFTFKGVDGTEESFKNLSGSGKTLLHVATHGFYYTQTDYDNKFNLSRVTELISNDFIPTEDKMLSRSGLLMAGANTALTKQHIPYNMEDGILTAQEISYLNFHDVDLVVLSACKSAMGELKGDGVFGLQRGFKKAGAQTLLMSLWDVDDRATQLLMEEFYKNWLGVDDDNTKGMSKRDAFLKAQNYLRSAENGKYKDPKYWAAFVMLDGIE